MAKHIGRPMGTYATIRTGRLMGLEDQDPAIECLAACLRRFLAPYRDKPLLIAGLGNAELLYDSLGPRVVRRVPAQFISAMDTPCMFQTVSLLTPGTLWQTNTSTATMISGVAQAIHAACVLLIDTSSVTRFEDMSSVIGVTSGGLKLSRRGELWTQDDLKVPLLAITVPLILSVPAKTVHMLHLNADPEGVMLTDINLAEDMRAAVSILSQAILRTAYPELELAAVHEIAKILQSDD